MSSCVSQSDLELLHAGGLEGHAAETVRHHLDRCEACRIAYEQFVKDDDFLKQARHLLRDHPVSQAKDKDDPLQLRRFAERLPEIPGYRIIAVLGHGGMGVVYRAIQTKLNRTVALKFLPSIIGTANPSSIRRFIREATAAARLHHTNIVPIYDFGECADGHYYAMELIDGQSLDQVIDTMQAGNASGIAASKLAPLLASASRHGSGPTPTGSTEQPPEASIPISSSSAKAYYRRVTLWIADAAEALHHAHKQGIIHRDIKPANLIVARDGRIMVTDFGLAKSTLEESLTITGSLLGTVRYLSPEQAMASRVPVDQRTDVYSLGATMYEMLAFTPAFPGDDEKQVLSSIISREPMPLRRIISHIPMELETICLKSLEKSPDKRYYSAGEMSADLRRYLQDQPIMARRPTVVQRAARFVRRRRVPVIVTVAVVLLTISGIMVLRARELQRTEVAQAREHQRTEVARAREHQRTAQITSLLDSAAGLLARPNRSVSTYEEAESKLNRVLALDPQNRKAVINLLRVAQGLYNSNPNETNRQKIAAAAEHGEELLQLTPNDAYLLNAVGVQRKILGEYDAAIELFERAIPHDPQPYGALSNLALVSAHQGDVQRALEHLRSAAGIVQDQEVSSLHRDVWRNLAAIEAFLDDTACLEHLNRAEQCDAGDPAIWVLRAQIHLTQSAFHDPSAALAAAQTPLRQDGTHARAHRLAALALTELQRPTEAKEEALAAIRHGDHPAINHLIIAVVRARQGNPKEARKSLRLAESLWPAELREAGDFTVDDWRGVLWFERASEWIALRDRVSTLIAGANDP